MSYIAKFNPYNMDAATVLSVATGRKALLRQVLNTLANNKQGASIAQHLLIRGPRGMGKSFFLKYLQINFNREAKFKDCEFLLLPEEQNNINSPSDLIKLVLNELTEKSGETALTQWEEPENLWAIELDKLKKYIAQKRASADSYHLVVVIENLDEFLNNIKHEKKTREVYESRFRHLLEKISHLTIIGATPRIDPEAIDGNYNQRLFHAFKKCTLKRWNEEDYFNYLERRRAIKEQQLGIAFSEEQTALMRAKLKAISHYTGGSPRMAVVLTDLLLEDDVLSTVETLTGLIDDLTPYYQDITKSIPKRSKILFDTLIRKGENISQSELARFVGATQSKIAKAFLWLKDNGYIIGKKRSNSPAFSYSVADRIHVLYYKIREVHHNKQITPIWLFSDFLVAFYQEKELQTHSIENHLLLEQRNSEKILLQISKQDKEAIFKKFGDAVIFTAKHKGIAKAFEVGNKLLLLLEEQKESLNVQLSLSKLYANWLNMQIAPSLFKDLCEEALSVFPDEGSQLITKAALSTVEYIEGGKNPAYLETLNPDMAIAIEAIVKEGEL